ncbi:MAG: flavin-dependent oxidoreductase [Hydrogenophaga sp.]|uniref:flavin-dependent oxidoreductase n=1 Tax=Hydrogenophaga sp. TaxID=1904254 RepID=UPI001D9E8CBF|nr:flavin-dependent oxidoreductase [Hydrogenophaga sp.]MBX3610017.1 flavin-dependent oxidoreductase [Hydrogenophaga sp.]
MKIAVVGGGIAGLAFALALHKRGLTCDVFEAAPEVKELGVGITLLPHAMRELDALGLTDSLLALAIENRESVFFNRWGQYVFSEPRGRHAGYDLPELGIHRGKLHGVLWQAAMQRLGAHRLHTAHRCVGISRGASGVRLQFDNGQEVQADIVVACDGVNSLIRRQLVPDDRVCYAGINTWRGVTVHKPILTGQSYIRIGSIDTGKMVIYPIVDNVDGQGNQLINWVAELRDPAKPMNDWNRPGRADDILPIFDGWRYDWLDVPALIAGAQQIFEYPMVDKDPLNRWGDGPITLMGDAAHPMYPRGSNGSAQALIDARTLADELAAAPDEPEQALRRYEAARIAATARVVQTNRTLPPDFIIMKADELSGGQPFASIDDLISQDELRAISDNYKQIAGFALKP